VPGSIQPHGVLLAVRAADRIVTHASANAGRIAAGPGPVVGEPLAGVLTEAVHDTICRGISECLTSQLCHVGTTNANGRGERFNILMHCTGDTLVIEFEPTAAQPRSSERLQDLLAQEAELLERTRSIEALCGETCAAVRRLTGFDKVMVYRFDDDWNGTTIAEDAADGMDLYLDLRFPASDIPAQARELYRLNPIRLIADVDYVPVPLDAADGAAAPLDLTHAVLRSVSPIHIEYLKNMGVAASMSVSILRDGRLWGLIACHHRSPHLVPYDVRRACTLLGKLVAQLISSIESRLDAEYATEVRQVQSRMLAQLAGRDDFVEALLDREGDLLRLVDADGVAVCLEGECRLLGKTPAEEEVVGILSHLAPEGALFKTDWLVEQHPEAERFRDRAAGLLVVTLSSVQRHYLVWFRAESVQTVRWAGNPNKPAYPVDGELRLHPRKSFETWKEQVGRKSRPWRSAELEAALSLREALVDAMLRRAEEGAARAKDQFLAVLSHELRTPLNPVLTVASALEVDPSLSAENREMMRIVRRNVELETRLIDDLLDVTRISKGKLALTVETLDVHTLVERSLEVCERDLSEKGMTVNFTRDAALAYVEGDSARLQQVLWNILRNAIKFTPPGGSISIRTDNPDPRRVRVEITDTGIGIAAELVPNIFNAFEQGDRTVTTRYGGLGLGMAIAKTLVELNGGRISVSSAGKGHGATFAIQLPVVPSPVAKEVATETTSSAIRGSAKLRILLVEDHKDTARIMARLLEQLDYEIKTADSLAAARKLTAIHSFDLVVSDLGLPDGSGNDLMRELREKYAIKGIALTGWGMEEDVRATVEAGFDRHLTKPINFQSLVSAIREVAQGMEHR
jgi:light-regulated signal transduction histidine kinase (bacteriophytochrome)/ActR/RegA family two-component response regulator